MITHSICVTYRRIALESVFINHRFYLGPVWGGACALLNTLVCSAANVAIRELTAARFITHVVDAVIVQFFAEVLITLFLFANDFGFSRKGFDLNLQQCTTIEDDAWIFSFGDGADGEGAHVIGKWSVQVFKKV